MTKGYPLVSIITVNYNGKHLLNACFESLYNLNYPKDSLEIIMVDNGSKDNSIEYIKDNFPDLNIIINNENNYTKANNLGIKAAKGEYIALINNDIRVDKNWLIELIKVAEIDTNIAGAGSKVLFLDGKINSSGHIELPNYYWADAGSKEEDIGQYNETTEVKSITGTACLYKNRYLKKVGLFDEDFHMFLEDVDISIRLRKQGWKIFYCPNSIAYHKFHGTADNDLVSFYVERNRLLLIAKHFPEKLNDSLIGNGYFTITNNIKKHDGLYGILAEIFSKLLKHHNHEIINNLLPDLFDTFKKIFNLEKYNLVQFLDCEKNNIRLKDIEITKKNEQLQLKDSEITKKNEQLQLKDSEITKKNEQLQLKDNKITQIYAQVEEKTKAITILTTELNNFKEQINNFYSSETFTYIIHPIWKTLDFFKSIKRLFFIQGIKTKNNKNHVLFIKPQQISAFDTEKIISNFKKENTETNISLVANLSYAEYSQLSKNNLIDEKILYCPNFKKFSFLEQIKIIFRLQKRRYVVAIVLVNEPFYPGYKRAEILAFLSGAKKIKQQFINKNCSEEKIIKKTLLSKDVLKHILLFPARILFLLIIVFIFLIFIVARIKIIKLFNKFIK